MRTAAILPVKSFARAKQRLGGALRQAGIVAGAMLYALDHHIDRLAEDHERAARLASVLGQFHAVEVMPVETNITAGRSLAVPSERDAASSITNPWKYRPSGMRTTKTSPVLGAFRLGLEHLQVHRVRLAFASPSAMRSPR